MQVDRVLPLLKSPVVSSEAYQTMEKFAGCVSTPSRDLGPDIAAALKMVATASILDDLQAPVEDMGRGKKQKPGVVDRVVAGLVSACKDGPLPAPSFALIFPVRHQFVCSPLLLGFLWFYVVKLFAAYLVVVLCAITRQW